MDAPSKLDDLLAAFTKIAVVFDVQKLVSFPIRDFHRSLQIGELLLRVLQ